MCYFYYMTILLIHLYIYTILLIQLHFYNSISNGFLAFYELKFGNTFFGKKIIITCNTLKLSLLWIKIWAISREVSLAKKTIDTSLSKYRNYMSFCQGSQILKILAKTCNQLFFYFIKKNVFVPLVPSPWYPKSFWDNQNIVNSIIEN